MTSISNRGLVLLILMTLALSIFTTLLSHNQMSRLSNQLSNMQTPTGFATASQSGTASINLSTDIAFVLNTDTLNWGSGIVNQTNPNCEIVTLTTVGTTSATLNPNNCWINSSGSSGAIVEQDDFLLENTGTSSVNVSINGTNSTNFFGFGTGASTNFMWRGGTVTGEEDACGTSGSGLTTSWTEFDDETTYDVVCGNLGYDNANDEIKIEINMTFNRSEVTSGQKTAYVYFLIENATI